MDVFLILKRLKEYKQFEFTSMHISDAIELVWLACYYDNGQVRTCVYIVLINSTNAKRDGRYYNI